MARKKKSTGVKVNFKGVESRSTPPEGDYKCEVLEAALGKSGAGNEQIEFTCEISEGKHKGSKLWFYCTLDEKSLWKLHAFLTALGQEVPDDDMDIDLAELVGSEFVGVLTHETYKGKKRAKLTDFDSIENYSGGDESEDDDDDDDDKKSSKKSKGKKAAKGKSKSDDDDDEDEDEDDKKSSKKSKSKKSKKDDDDEDEDEDEKPKKGKKSKSKSKASDDDDDDEDEKPAKGKKGAKDKKSKKPKKLDREDIEDMDEDELQELIDEHDLDVDLDEIKKLPKKVAAVLEALEEADLVDEED